jgi:putative Mg2+ transporter-C (MgtC) family protein
MTDFEWEPLIKLAVAAALGALIGLERELHGRPAGMRTNALVCAASALLIIVSRGGAMSGLESDREFMLNVDPARMAAGIVTGIGFLGAGAILRIRESLIRSLTTAAGIWFVAAVGITVGLGAWVMALAATVLALVVLMGLQHLERTLGAVVYRTLTVTVAQPRRDEVEKTVRTMVQERKMRLQQVTYRIDNGSEHTRLLFALRADRRHDDGSFVYEIAGMDGVTRAMWS